MADGVVREPLDQLLFAGLRGGVLQAALQMQNAVRLCGRRPTRFLFGFDLPMEDAIAYGGTFCDGIFTQVVDYPVNKVQLYPRILIFSERIQQYVSIHDDAWIVYQMQCPRERFGCMVVCISEHSIPLPRPCLPDVVSRLFFSSGPPWRKTVVAKRASVDPPKSPPDRAPASPSTPGSFNPRSRCSSLSLID